MSSSTSSTSFLAARRRQQWLIWVAGAVLVIGVTVLLGFFLSHGSNRPANVNFPTIPSRGPSSSKSAAKNPRVPASADALKVARTFLETAVLRKNLDVAYPLVGPSLKRGMSRAQWRKGKIAVVPYPAANAKTAKLAVQSSHKNELRLLVALTGRKGSNARPLAFYLNVDRLGGKWVVNYWASTGSATGQHSTHSTGSREPYASTL
jgi:hypothetical protein